MPDNFFWDSNLWVYLNTQSQDVGDMEKRRLLEKRFLTTLNIVVSVQVINELANVLFKKYQQSEAEIRGRIEQILLQVDIVTLTEELPYRHLRSNPAIKSVGTTA